MVYYKSVGRPFFSGLLGLEDFSKFFPRGTVVIFGFTHRKLRKELFCQNFQNPAVSPFPTSMVNNIRRKLINPDIPTFLMNETLSRYHMKANFHCRCLKEKYTAANKKPTAWRKLLNQIYSLKFFGLCTCDNFVRCISIAWLFFCAIGKILLIACVLSRCFW